MLLYNPKLIINLVLPVDNPHQHKHWHTPLPSLLLSLLNIYYPYYLIYHSCVSPPFTVLLTIIIIIIVTFIYHWCVSPSILPLWCKLKYTNTDLNTENWGGRRLKEMWKYLENEKGEIREWNAKGETKIWKGRNLKSENKKERERNKKKIVNEKFEIKEWKGKIDNKINMEKNEYEVTEWNGKIKIWKKTLAIKKQKWKTTWKY